MRHWKQRWDPKADLVFCRRMRMGTAKNPFVIPGDPVTPMMRAKLGIVRLRRWWDAMMIGRADFSSNVRGGVVEKVEPELYVNSAALLEALAPELEPKTSELSMVAVANALSGIDDTLMDEILEPNTSPDSKSLRKDLLYEQASK